MRTIGREVVEAGLLAARLEAYEPGEYVGQESFMRATEIRDLATRAAIGAGTSVLDLCCGVAGPGRLIAEALGCTYLGVDRSPDAIAVARRRAGPRCRFTVADVPPVPEGGFDVVLLLETMLAFADKAPLLGAVAGALVPGGRFACTVETGAPLTAAERSLMPASDTVWPVPDAELRSSLEDAGLRVTWETDSTRAHHTAARALTRAFSEHAGDIRAHLGDAFLDDLLTAHRLWTHWLEQGRIRKLTLVATRGGG